MRILPAVAVVALVAACGPSALEVKAAKFSRYEAKPDEVWLAVHDEVVKEYKEIDFEDPQQGIIVSKYRWFDAQGAAKKMETPNATEGDAVFRIIVQVKKREEGGFQIAVDGDAQILDSGSPVPVHYPHGDAREPYWVKGKIEGMYVRLHDRLKGSAKPLPEGEKEPTIENVPKASTVPVGNVGGPQ